MKIGAKIALYLIYSKYFLDFLCYFMFINLKMAHCPLVRQMVGFRQHHYSRVV
jgi:hypothetical protein